MGDFEIGATGHRLEGKGEGLVVSRTVVQHILSRTKKKITHIVSHGLFPSRAIDCTRTDNQ